MYRGTPAAGLSTHTQNPAIPARTFFGHRPSTLGRMDYLTARESEIAALVSQGLTNRAIATELCLSLRTVQNHLYSIYSKLDINNRTALALAIYRGTLREAV